MKLIKRHTVGLGMAALLGAYFLLAWWPGEKGSSASHQDFFIAVAGIIAALVIALVLYMQNLSDPAPVGGVLGASAVGEAIALYAIWTHAGTRYTAAACAVIVLAQIVALMYFALIARE